MFRDYAHFGVAAGALLLGVAPASAGSYDYKDIAVPGVVDTRAIAVNASRQVAGSYTTPTGLVRTFVLRKGVIQTIQAPSPQQDTNILPTAIGPTGLVVGVFGDRAPIPFKLAANSTVPTKISYPSANGARLVVPTSISQNKLEDVAGYYTYEGRILAFNTQQHGDSFVTIEVPNAKSTTTTAFAQSSVGYEIPVGNYITDRQHGFLGSSTAPIDPPGSLSTTISYLNNGGPSGGDLGGFYTAKDGYTVGFVRRGSTFKAYRYPYAPHTTVTRNLGDVVFGEFKDIYGRSHGFVFANDQYQLVGDLNDEVTLTSVADDGSFVGAKRSADGHFQGYLATCPAGPGACEP